MKTYVIENVNRMIKLTYKIWHVTKKIISKMLSHSAEWKCVPELQFSNTNILLSTHHVSVSVCITGLLRCSQQGYKASK